MDKEIQENIFLTLQEAWFWFTYKRGPFDLFKSPLNILALQFYTLLTILCWLDNGKAEKNQSWL